VVENHQPWLKAANLAEIRFLHGDVNLISN
jgi:hypothetical protein